MSTSMKAISTTADTPLALGEVARPEPGPGEIVIDIRAAGLNRADLIQRKGMYPPPPGAPDTMGLECAGIVAQTGPGVERWQPGDRVCALLGGGGYAEAVAVDAGSVLAIPDGMDFDAAACLPEAMMTVWANVFDRCALAPGETFLCQGGTSGIGVMALQMAKCAGAGAIYTTAGTDEKCALARDLGADIAVNYKTADFGETLKDEAAPDVVLDMVGGNYVQKHIDLIGVNGRICNIAYQAGSDVRVNLIRLMLKRAILTGTTLRARAAKEKRRIRDAVERDFWPHVSSGRIRAIIDSRFALCEAEAAQARMAEGGHSGKIVLVRDA